MERILAGQALNKTSGGVGLLFANRGSAVPVFLGSCFSLFRPSIIVTAYHCIRGIKDSEVVINHHGAPGAQLFERPKRVIFSEKIDIAVMEIDAAGGKWSIPFKGLQYTADLGEPVGSLGHPDNLIGDEPNRETQRLFRGHIQRPFVYSGGRSPYSAFELNFASPAGLSGAPLFLISNPSIVLGVITANFQSTTAIDEEITDGTDPPRTHRRVIEFGVASNIFHATELFEKILGSRLPDPSPFVIP